jgi:hypothetical protein
MWYAVYTWQGETGWQRKNVFADETPDLARSMVLLDESDGLGSVALIEADTREAAESFPRYNGGWRRISAAPPPS